MTKGKRMENPVESAHLNPCEISGRNGVEISNQIVESQAGFIQKAFDEAVISGRAVDLLLIDDNSLQKSFFDKSVKAAHDKQIFKFRVHGFMDFFRSTGTKVIDQLQQLKFPVSYPNIISSFVHEML